MRAGGLACRSKKNSCHLPCCDIIVSPLANSPCYPRDPQILYGHPSHCALTQNSPPVLLCTSTPPRRPLRPHMCNTALLHRSHLPRAGRPSAPHAMSDAHNMASPLLPLSPLRGAALVPTDAHLARTNNTSSFLLLSPPPQWLGLLSNVKPTLNVCCVSWRQSSGAAARASARLEAAFRRRRRRKQRIGLHAP